VVIGELRGTLGALCELAMRLERAAGPGVHRCECYGVAGPFCAVLAEWLHSMFSAIHRQLSDTPYEPSVHRELVEECRTVAGILAGALEPIARCFGAGGIPS
jgi:hypothetical protein